MMYLLKNLGTCLIFPKTETTGRIPKLPIKDTEIKGIILSINSPGGEIDGLFSLMRYIRQASGKKPIYAYIHGGAYSAAYAIAAACSKVYIAEDAETGSCGAYGRAVEDDEKFLRERYGILQRVFRSANAPKKNLSVITNEEAAKEFQAAIDKAGEDYIRLVAEMRGIDPKTAAEGFGRGGVVSAEYALQHGMVDAIGTPEELIEDISSRAEDTAAEGGGEDMDRENVSGMSAEERTQLFGALVAFDSSLLSPAREEATENERNRITGLLAFRVDGNAEVNALVDEAIRDGKTASDISLQCFEIMKKAAAAPQKATVEATLEALADETQVLPVKQGEDTVDALIDRTLKEEKR